MFDSGMEFVESCSKVGKFDLQIEKKVMRKIEILMEKRDGIEWLCYLVGEIEWKKKKGYIYDLYIPETQENTMGNVDNFSCPDDIRKKIIGVIHSHHRMGCFFSKTDHEYINKNHHVSIVVSNKNKQNEMLAVVRKRTDCGCYTFIKPKIKIGEVMYYFGESDFILEVDEKIEKSKGINEFYEFLNNKSIDPLKKANLLDSDFPDDIYDLEMMN